MVSPSQNAFNQDEMSDNDALSLHESIDSHGLSDAETDSLDVGGPEDFDGSFGRSCTVLVTQVHRIAILL